MIDKLSHWLHKVSKGWVTLLALAVMIIFMVTVLPAQAASAEQNAGGSISPDTSFFYGPGQLLQAAKDYGPEGRLAYILVRWTFDLIFPIVYISFLVTGISWFYQKLVDPIKWISYTNLLPIGAGILDYLENSGASLVMGMYPGSVPGLALLTAIFSGMKWLVITASFLAYFSLGGAALIQSIRHKTRI